MSKFGYRHALVFFILISGVAPMSPARELIPEAGEDGVLIRNAAVAGTFYPADPAQLESMLDRLLDHVPAPEEPQKLLAMILPHAGYVYSGSTAALGYKLLSEQSYDTVVLIGPSHQMNFPGISVWREGAWVSPLGEVPIDEELAEKIAGSHPHFGFPTTPHRTEHSLEVQIPFLQKTLKKFKLVPIAMGRLSLEDARDLAASIHQHSVGKKVLVIASTDMSHYHPADIAERMDAVTADLIARGDTQNLFEALRSGKSELCGAPAVLTVLEYARISGARSPEILHYSHSGQVTGDLDRVVGYLAVRVPLPETSEKLSVVPAFTEEEKQEMLRMARTAVETYVRAGQIVEPSARFDSFKQKQAVFVTLRLNGALRGCIGHILPYEKLYLAVRNNAIAAASQDPRFEPVKQDELASLSYEINVLGSPQKIQTWDPIILGTHGVIVKKGGRQGVFLPEVAVETGWDKTRFMNELCTQKAGLAERCWEDPGTELFMFTSTAFSETPAAV